MKPKAHWGRRYIPSFPISIEVSCFWEGPGNAANSWSFAESLSVRASAAGPKTVDRNLALFLLRTLDLELFAIFLTFWLRFYILCSFCLPRNSKYGVAAWSSSTSMKRKSSWTFWWRKIVVEKGPRSSAQSNGCTPSIRHRLHMNTRTRNDKWKYGLRTGHNMMSLEHWWSQFNMMRTFIATQDV